jgi:hypothetical protein
VDQQEVGGPFHRVRMFGLVLRLLAVHQAEQPDELATHVIGQGEVVVGRHRASMDRGSGSGNKARV